MTKKNYFKKFVCPTCFQALEFINSDNKSENNGSGWGLLRCSCAEYPYVMGIAYLQRNKQQEKAVAFLHEGNIAAAAVSLLDLNRRLRLMFRIVIFSTAVNRIVFMIRKKELAQSIGYDLFIRLLCVFSFSKPWAWYIRKRKTIPSYYFSVLATHLKNTQTQCVLDVGCGVGHLLKEFSKKTKGFNLFGIDRSFTSLLLARLFFVQQETILVCADIEKNIPCGSECFDLMVIADSFHDIKNKKKCIEETVRITSKTASIALLHTLNGGNGKQSGMIPYRATRLLKKSGYKQVSVYSNETLWKTLVMEKPLSLRKSDSTKTLRNCYAYSLFASKKQLPEQLSLSSEESLTLLSADINYRQDPVLAKIMEKQAGR